MHPTWYQPDMAVVVALALLASPLACNTSAQNCPPAQYCTAQDEQFSWRCPSEGTCEQVPDAPALELWLPIRGRVGAPQIDPDVDVALQPAPQRLALV
jgi:hypothetical protein